ncbi:MAG: electron transfer flavoprotein subunit alpha/FixB family protein [Chloroflexi bacterium]|nr:electron transfer flavoprotein subunit alpha/FixB family protein [Chloroflexota bacterium]
MNGEVLVLAEHTAGELDSITLELLGKGRELADALGDRLSVVVVGRQLQGAIDRLADKADRLYYVDDPDLGVYNAEVFGEILAAAARKIAPRLFLMGYTYLGMELGPALAMQLEMPLVSNCLGIELRNHGKVAVERPLCGGTLRAREECDLPLMVSAPLTAFSAKAIRACQADVVRIPYPGERRSLRTRVREVVGNISGESTIARSDMLVAVGRGMGSPDKLRLFQELAKVLGAALACSRPVVDMGWLSSDHLVGLSGSTVRPRIYIACGISGAAQHIAGMSGSSTVIAINKDPLAPIFNVAHHGIVGDMFDVVPQIIDEWSRRSSARTAPVTSDHNNTNALNRDA